MLSILAALDLWKFAGGLGIFLLSMKLIESALVDLSGRSFKRYLREYTKTPLRGILSGTFATAILQSSSLVTLMVLSFVGAGVIEMRSALGVVIGSNLGTTFTGWIVTLLGFKLDVQSFCYPLLGIGGLLYTLLPKDKKTGQFFQFLAALGLLFLGLDFMKQAMASATDKFDVSAIHDTGPVVHFVFGFIFTAIIQSSSAAMMTTLAALNANIVNLPGAAAIIIGADLGTTITALLGGLGGSPAKKQTAMAHFSFNFITDAVALACIKPLLFFVVFVFGKEEPLLSLVLLHSTFNALGMFAFFPFIGFFARILEKKIGQKTEITTKFIHRVNPQMTEAALAVLNEEIYYLVNEVLSFNLKAYAIESIGRNISLCYEELKEQISTVLSYALNIQSQPTNTEESKRLTQLLKALDALSRSIKSAKDIHHNLNSINDSASLENIEFQREILSSIQKRFSLIKELISFDNQSHIFEELVGFEKLNNNEYQNQQKIVYGYFHSSHLKEMEIANLLNINRGVHASFDALCIGLKEILLSAEKAEDV